MWFACRSNGETFRGASLSAGQLLDMTGSKQRLALDISPYPLIAGPTRADLADHDEGGR